MHGERAQELATQQLEAAARETQQLKDEADRQQAKALEEARRRIETCRRVVQRMVREHLARAWACFTESIWSSKRNHETLRRVLKRTSHRLLAVAFEGYSKAVSTENSRRKKVTKVVGRWTLPGLIKALEAWVDYVQINKKTCQVRTEEAKEQIVIQELTNQVQKLTADAADKDKAMDELQSVLRSKEQQLEQLLELLGKQDLQGPPATAI
jgi:type I restriction-modification system DNA methylase subunit